MDVTVLHGDDLIKSRAEFDRQKNQAGGEVICLEGKNLNPTELTQALESQSLLSDHKSVFIENFYKSARSDTQKILLERLTQPGPQVIIWEATKLKSQQKNLFKRARFIEFLLPKLIFVYLESLRPRNQQKSLSLLKKVISQYQPGYVFQMLIWQIRQLLIVRSENFSQFFALNSWLAKKFKNQSSCYSSHRLRQLQEMLLTIDLGQKRGSLQTLKQDLIEFTIKATS